MADKIDRDAAVEFEKWWAEREAEGYRYGRGPLATVRFGFEAGFARAAASEPAGGVSNDTHRAGMLHAAQIVNNEFWRSPEAAREHDSVWMGGYESACDHLSIVIERAAAIDCVTVQPTPTASARERAQELVDTRRFQVEEMLQDWERTYGVENLNQFNARIALIDRIAALVGPTPSR